MKRSVKWGTAILLSPFVLFIILCIFIYIPPIQNFLVQQATRYASESTGMHISIKRISLSFPLDLVVHNTLAVQGRDTILQAEQLTVKVQLLPLLKQQIELDGLELKKATVNTSNLIEGMQLKGDLGKLFISSHGVALSPETAIVNKFLLENTHVTLCLNDTTPTPPDTTSSAPMYWKIMLQKINLQNVSFHMQMPLDSIDMQLQLNNASLSDGLVDLHQMAYSARHFEIRKSKINYNTGNQPQTVGLDPTHIAVTNLNLSLDSLYYAGNDMKALIKEFDLEERSGLKITSAQGRLVSNDKTLSVPSLQIKTTDSFIEFTANMDWGVTDTNSEGNMHARLMADIGKTDLFRLLPDMPEELVKYYPSAPLQIRAGIDGNLNQLNLTNLTVRIPEVFQSNISGSITNPLDSIYRDGSLSLSTQTQNMQFISQIAKGIAIPSDVILESKNLIKGTLLQTTTTLTHHTDSIFLSGGYNLSTQEYAAKLDIKEIDLHKFIPQDSLYALSASAKVQGKGFDIFSHSTSAQLEAELNHLEYGSRFFSGVQMDATVTQNKLLAHLNAKDNAIDIQTTIEGLFKPKQIDATVNASVNQLDLYAMQLTSNPLKVSQQISVTLQTDMKQTHKVRADVTNNKLITAEKTFSTKDLHAGLALTKDSIRSFVNAGDLTFLFKSQQNLDKLTASLNKISKELDSQWKKKYIDQPFIKTLLPTTRIKIISGKDNPIANLLSSNHIYYNRLLIDLNTSAQTGLNGSVNLYGLHTDSLSLDSIYFTAQQDTAEINFRSGIKALANSHQEAFDVSLNGYVGANDAQMMIEYLNGQKEQGAYIGFNANLRNKGISLHVIPEEPTLVYRPFKVNPRNYIYLSDKGKIFADMSLYDKNHTGMHLYSAPDSTVQQDITFMLNKIDIAEFRRIIPYMPDIAGSITAETHYVQNESESQIALETTVEKLAYNKQPLGDWSISTVYLPKENGEHSIDGFVVHNEEEVMTINGSYFTPLTPKGTDKIMADMEIHHFPLPVANAFIPDKMAMLKGDIDGNLSISGSTTQPLFNGEIGLDSVAIDIPQASLNLRFDNRPVKITDSKLVFKDFSIFTEGKTPFAINGTVDMKDMAQIQIDLKMNAHNFELLNAKRTKEALVYGKLYVDFNSVLKGTPESLTMRGNMNILGSSNFTYVLKDSPLTVEDRLNETVTFVNFSDTAQTTRHPVQAMTLGGIDMLMTLHIDEAVQCRVDLNEDGSNYMLLEGGGDLSFQYQPDGNMLLNGRYALMSGEMKYAMPIIPLKTFYIQSGSYIEWTGNVMNPNLNIKASERVRASVTQEGQSSRMVTFNVGVSITNRLENLGFTFTLEAPEDGTIQNELASMSAEEKNKLAVTMLVTGMYLSESNMGSGKAFNTNNVLNSFLQKEIQSIAGDALKTVDINFGMETTNEEETGSSRTDYNFQFAKRFWNNRFRVVIGGKISTGNDVQQDESFIDNVSLEYRLDNSGTRYIKLFHDKNYESILDGEVIETGAGIVLRKKISRLGELFIFRNRKKNPIETQTNEKEK